MLPLAVIAAAVSGSATFSLPPQLAVTPTGRAKDAPNGVTLPVTRELVDGTFRLAGGVKIGKRTLTAFEFDGKRVTAKVDGLLRRTAFVVVKPKGSSGPGRTSVKGALDGTAVVRDANGRLNFVAVAKSLRVVGGRTDLVLGQQFLDVLSAEQITPGGGEGAPITEGGAIGLPVSGGRVTSKRYEGAIDHGGGLTLSKTNQPLVRLEDYLLDTRTNLIRGRINDAERVDLFSAGLPAPSLDGSIVTFADATAALTATAAEALNAAFKTSAFTEGLALGTFTVRAEVD